MKKILKLAKSKDPKTYIRTCPQCKTEFSYQDEDINPIYPTESYVACPICKTNLIHNKYFMRNGDISISSSNLTTEKL